MTRVIPEASVRDALAEVLEQGRERARVLDRPILASLARPLSCDFDPLALFSVPGRPVTYRMFWGQPEQDFWLVGIGSAAVLTSEGSVSMRRVSDEHHALLETAAIQGPVIRGVGPVMLGGFRYDTQVPRDVIWRDFPDALMILPRFLFTWSQGATWLTVNTLVAPGSDPVAQAKALTAELQAINAVSLGEGRQPSAQRLAQSSPEEWSRWVRSVLHAIESGPLTKVVLARRKTLFANEYFSVESALGKLIRAYPGCSVFAIDNGEASFIGATPERLARVDKGTLSVSCLAGTTARGDSPEEDWALQKQMLDSPKERREHAAVVATVTAELKELCRELHWNDEPHVLRMRNVQHLRTPVTGDLWPGSGLLDVVRRLHPTPAVAGVPTEGAMKFIREVEGDRGWYAAPVGWVDQAGGGEFAVAIRSALLRGNRAFLSAGCGIVKGSDPDQEFRETELKFQPLLAALSGS